MVDATIGGVCSGSVCEVAVALSVDAGDDLGSMSHACIPCVMGSQWELNAVGSRSQ